MAISVKVNSFKLNKKSLCTYNILPVSWVLYFLLRLVCIEHYGLGNYSYSAASSYNNYNRE